MEKPAIIILGRGEHAKVVIEIIEQEGVYNIFGITDKDSRPGETYLGYPVLGDDSILPSFLKKGINNVALGVGGYRNNINRTKIFEHVKQLGFNVPVHCHPSANVSPSAKIGEGSVIFPGVNLNTGAQIGRNNILVTGVNIDHSTKTGDHVLISAGVTIGGEVNIGDGVLCALGANVISGITIGPEILIGAGAVVVKDLTEKGIYLGCPATKK